MCLDAQYIELASDGVEFPHNRFELVTMLAVAPECHQLLLCRLHDGPRCPAVGRYSLDDELPVELQGAVRDGRVPLQRRLHRRCLPAALAVVPIQLLRPRHLWQRPGDRRSGVCLRARLRRG